MHGIIFFQFNSFFVKNHGPHKWNELLRESELENKLYIPTKVYPDDDLKSLIHNAARLNNQTTSILLQEFGEFIVPSLLKVYAASINKDWTLFDLLENTEKSMHRAVRLSDKMADPPSLVCKRISRCSVQIEYTSNRNMVDLGIGIIYGLANYYNESISLKKKDINNGYLLEITRSI
ncbi:MAG: heme NO-binding domain-containing protein [Chitinophagaceae bacterium]|jgi:hypothetical protein|nr:heme NO-binding domain-containing protein [Chitinophagaceae bacterium]